MKALTYYLHRIAVHARSAFARMQIRKTGCGVLFESVREIRGGGGIQIGDRSVFGTEARLSCWGQGKIAIGNNCHFGDRVFLTSALEIVIGDDVLTGGNVLISDNAHGETTLADMAIAPIDRQIHCKGPVKIGNRVWIGNNVCVMSGVTIGEGAIVGANSVVIHNVAPYCVVAGTPARIINNNLKENV